MHRSHKDTLPPFARRLVYWIQIKRPHTRQQIHLVCSNEETALVLGHNLPEEIECDNDGPSEIFLEEGSRAGITTDGL